MVLKDSDLGLPPHGRRTEFHRRPKRAPPTFSCPWLVVRYCCSVGSGGRGLETGGFGGGRGFFNGDSTSAVSKREDRPDKGSSAISGVRGQVLG